MTHTADKVFTDLSNSLAFTLSTSGWSRYFCNWSPVPGVVFRLGLFNAHWLYSYRFIFGEKPDCLVIRCGNFCVHLWATNVRKKQVIPRPILQKSRRLPRTKQPGCRVREGWSCRHGHGCSNSRRARCVRVQEHQSVMVEDTTQVAIDCVLRRGCEFVWVSCSIQFLSWDKGITDSARCILKMTASRALVFFFATRTLSTFHSAAERDTYIHFNYKWQIYFLVEVPLASEARKWKRSSDSPRKLCCHHARFPPQAEARSDEGGPGDRRAQGYFGSEDRSHVKLLANLSPSSCQRQNRVWCSRSLPPGKERLIRAWHHSRNRLDFLVYRLQAEENGKPATIDRHIQNLWCFGHRRKPNVRRRNWKIIEGAALLGGQLASRNSWCLSSWNKASLFSLA